MTVAAAYAQQGLPAQHGLVQLPRLLLQQSRKGLQLRVAGCVGIREHRARRQLHGRGYLLQGLPGRARVPDGQRRQAEIAEEEVAELQQELGGRKRRWLHPRLRDLEQLCMVFPIGGHAARIRQAGTRTRGVSDGRARARARVRAHNARATVPSPRVKNWCAWSAALR